MHGTHTGAAEGESSDDVDFRVLLAGGVGSISKSSCIDLRGDLETGFFSGVEGATSSIFRFVALVEYMGAVS